MAMVNRTLGGRIAAHLLQIHPTHWTVFGNQDSQLKEVWMPKLKQLLVSSLFAGGKSKRLRLKMQQCLWKHSTIIVCIAPTDPIPMNGPKGIDKIKR
jgi:hypothetical protein